MGFSFALLIAVFVWQESQGNKDLRNADSQYILTSEWKDPNMGIDFATIAPLAKQLKEQYPHLVANYYRWDGITSTIAKNDKNFREEIQLGDESFLNMYNFKLLHGNANTAFKNPFSVVIKSEKAIKFFGRTNVIGETLMIQNFNGENHEFTITGVLKKSPENSVSLVINKVSNGFFIGKNSAHYFDRAHFQDWTNPAYVSYIELQPGINAKQLEAPLKSLISTHTSTSIKNNLKVTPIKLTDYYLNRNNSSLKKMLYTLSVVGVFILLMAMVNFINIITSYSGSRIKEIGVRKVLGGNKKQLIYQFLAESFVLVSLSTILAFISYPFLSTWFSKLVGKELIAISQLPPTLIWVPIPFILIISLLVGFYPAFVLSSFKSINALQGKLKVGNKNTYFRKSLLSFQYVTALVVFIGAILITQQLDSFFSKSLGYNKEFIVTAAVPRDWSKEGVNKMLAIRDQLSKIPTVENVSLSYEIPNGNNGFQVSVYKTGNSPEQSYSTQGLVTDETYLKTYGIPLIAGTFLNPGNAHPNSVVINKTALNAYGFKTAKEAIGQNLSVIDSDDVLTIQGVIDDFHFESMQQEIKPQLFFNVNTDLIYRYLSFKISPENINKSLTIIQQKWKSLMPNSPIEYKFMDDTLASLYASELQLKKAIYTASVLSLIIVLLGVFSMVSLTINKRIKEIGIRKVLGASEANISFLFIKEFLFILSLSIIIACPLAYLLINHWLANYAYKITIGLTPFLLGIIFIGSVTALLILFQTLKTAFSNPINSLKTE